jgi:hypothetical protein
MTDGNQRRRTVHILEPTILHGAGHHLAFARHAQNAFARAGLDSLLHISAHSDLWRNAPDMAGTFASRYSPAFALASSLQACSLDAPVARLICRWRARSLAGEHSTETGNLRYARAERLAQLVRHLKPLHVDSVAAGAVAQEVGELLRSIEALGGAGRDVLYLPTGERFLLEALERNASSIGRMGLAVHVRHWCLQSLESPGVNLTSMIAKTDRALKAAGAAIFWYAETRAAAHEIARVTGRACDLQTSHAFVSPDAWIREDIMPQPGSTRFLRVLAPGGVRRFPDKGMAFLAQFADRLRSCDGVRLVMQSFPADLFPRERKSLETSGRTIFLPSVLSDAAYEAELDHADAVIVPYDRKTWMDPTRGSGVVFDALSRGLPLFVKAGLPIAEELKDYVHGVVKNPEDLLEQVSRLIDFEERVRFQGNALRFAAQHASNPMLQRLLVG